MNEEAKVPLVRAADLASQVPYAYAAVAPPGRQLVFTAGACPLNAAGEIVNTFSSSSLCQAATSPRCGSDK